jgi:hypothetical protein
MTRGTVRVEMGRFSATLTGSSGVREAIARTGARSMPHATRKHKSGAVLVPLGGDLDDVIAALEAAGVPVEIVGRDGNPVAAGGLLGAAGDGGRR